MTPTPEPEPLYHGTRRPFGRGGLLVPGDDVGADHHGLGRSGWVYVTPDFELAKEYARAAQGRGRAKVVQVRPWGEVYVDDSTIAGGEEQESYRCEAATVLRRVWIEETRSEPPIRRTAALHA
jgi:hypothetical protein